MNCWSELQNIPTYPSVVFSSQIKNRNQLKHDLAMNQQIDEFDDHMNHLIGRNQVRADDATEDKNIVKEDWSTRNRYKFNNLWNMIIPLF